MRSKPWGLLGIVRIPKNIQPRHTNLFPKTHQIHIMQQDHVLNLAGTYLILKAIYKAAMVYIKALHFLELPR